LARWQVPRRGGGRGLRSRLDDELALQVRGQAVHQAAADDGMALELLGQSFQEGPAL
jgi:hypothetical protein